MADLPPPQEEKKPAISISPAGDMTVFIPLFKVDEVFARGLVDIARSSVLDFYAKARNEARKMQEETSRLANKGFVSKLFKRS